MTLGKHCYLPQQFTQQLFLKPWQILRIWWDILRPDVVLNIKNIRFFSGSKNLVGWRPTIVWETPSLLLLRRHPFWNIEGVGSVVWAVNSCSCLEVFGWMRRCKGTQKSCTWTGVKEYLGYQMLALIPVMPPALRNESYNITVWALKTWEETPS